MAQTTSEHTIGEYEITAVKRDGYKDLIRPLANRQKLWEPRSSDQEWS